MHIVAPCSFFTARRLWVHIPFLPIPLLSYWVDVLSGCSRFPLTVQKCACLVSWSLLIDRRANDVSIRTNIFSLFLAGCCLSVMGLSDFLPYLFLVKGHNDNLTLSDWNISLYHLQSSRGNAVRLTQRPREIQYIKLSTHIPHLEKKTETYHHYQTKTVHFII